MRDVELVLPVCAKLGECPRWDESNGLLYWVDINGFTLNRFDPLTQKNVVRLFEEEVGCFSLRTREGFVLAMRSGFYLLDDWEAGLEFVADPEADLKKNRFNDGRCDALGRFIAGTYYPPKDYDGANLWSLGRSEQVTQLEQGLLTANGTAFSPDNQWFYLADTPKHVIYRYRYDLASGAISDKTIFHQFPVGHGRPDGAAVDSAGNYWTALYEGGCIACLNPEGEIIEEIAVPAKCPTMVAFGDEDLKSLYITTVGERPEEEKSRYPNAGGLFKVRVDVPGMIEHRFAG